MTNIKAWEIIHYGLMGCMEAELVCLRHHPIRNKCNCSVLILYLNLEWCYSSDVTVQLGHSVMSNSLWPHGLQHTRLPCPSLSSRVCSNSRPLNQWCHPTISFSVTPLSSCPQSFPVSVSFPVSWLFASGIQSIGASASVLPMNIQGWFPIGLTCLIPLQARRL